MYNIKKLLFKKKNILIFSKNTKTTVTETRYYINDLSKIII